MSGFSKGDMVVVTGAGQGIGRAIAFRLAKAGASLALWDLSAGNLAETAYSCTMAGARVLVANVDVSNPATVDAAATAVLEENARPFALVNNAGIFPRASLFEADAGLWQKVLGVNLIGAFNCAQALARPMMSAGRGAIINISSGLALEGATRGAHYAASKAGLMALTKSLALELAPAIRVNCVLPGITETAQPLQDMDIERLHRIGEAVPLKRVGQSEDIAGMVAFLLSPDASYITGQSYSVSGGALMVP